MAAVALLLGKLPPFSNRRVLIEGKQSVNDIIREVLTAHRIFATDYDKIAADFWQGSVYNTCLYLWNFCKSTVKYKVEQEENQTTKSPAAILTQATGDCKHYAGFIGGVLDALNRQGKKINFVYRFAAYNGNTEVPEHVFIVVKDRDKIIWVDPVLKTFDERLTPSYYTDKKINMLTRISGIGDIQKTFLVSDVLDNIDFNSNPALYLSVQLLLKYGIMNANAKINTAAIARYKNRPGIYNEITTALQTVQQQNQVGSLFGDIWRVTKVITLAAPRAAYLSLVAINAFGYATKLKSSIYNPDGSFSAYKEKIKTLWQDRLGGQFSVLLNTVNNGATKKAILGAAPAIPVWVATATAIIAAITPIITAALKARQTAAGSSMDLSLIDPVTGQPYGAPNITSAGPLDWIKNNPVIVAGGLAAIYFLTRKKRTAAA